MFGRLFSRKSQADLKQPDEQRQQLRTPSPSIDSASRANHSPSHILPFPGSNGASPAPQPPPTPSPPPSEVDVAALHSLMLSVPPKVLHAYTLSHLTSSAVSYSALSALTAFFHELAPPPSLHCVRCHKDYFDIENDDRSCTVQHDDESAEVERVGSSKTKESASGYETLWGCCGKTVEGDGDMGPPDGWCYEGKHTTDPKRARFRADSTPQDDKLISCFSLNCHNVRATLPPIRSASKRPRPDSMHHNAEEEEEEWEKEGADAASASDKSATRKTQDKGHARKDSASSANSKRGRPPKGKGKEKAQEAEAGCGGMAVDAPSSSPSPKRRSGSHSRAKPRSTAAGSAPVLGDRHVNHVELGAGSGRGRRKGGQGESASGAEDAGAKSGDEKQARKKRKVIVSI